MSTNRAEFERYRAIADEVMQRAKGDGTAMQKFKDDPVGVLSAAGLPDSFIGDLLSETNLTAEVSGYMKSDCPWTCPFTKCYGTSF
jgi:hypothetical protein